MTIEQLEISDFRLQTSDFKSGPKADNEQFAQYLMAIKGAKLTETQLRQLGETTAGDDRTRTIEKINQRKANADDEQYRKLRGNGYTVGEIRRGAYQIDKALERKSLDVQRDAAHQKAVQNADASQESQHSRLAERSGQAEAWNAAQHGTAGQSASELPGVPGTMPNDVTANPIGQSTQDANTATLQTPDVTNASVQQAEGDTASSMGNGSRISGAANTTRNIAEQVAVKVSEQQANYHTTLAGKTAASLATALAGMTPVSRSESTKLNGELDAKISAVGQTNTAKVNAKDNLTREALTAASETQQTAHDPGQSQPDPGAAQAPKDVAASQMLPSTSLMEQLDQARLTNRVTAAFRSLANQSGTIRMKLHPEELGALTIRMQVESGKVVAKLEAETETARRVLLENMETLKKKLKEQNLEVAAFDIEVTPSGTGKDNITMPAQQPGLPIARKSKDQNDHVDFYS